MDNKWWKAYAEKIAGEHELWTSHPEAARIFKLNFVKSIAGGGVSDFPGTIKQGGNSGFQAVGLAILFGASKIVLLGYDMKITGTKKHWHADHKKELGNPVPQRMHFWQQAFNSMASETAIPIVNATRDTALKCFPRVDLDACLSEPAPQCTSADRGLSVGLAAAGL